MADQPFPLEKIFGSRTRVKVMTLFTTGVKRPYFVREISRIVNERLNAVRRELGILEKIGMLTSFEEKRRKYYVVQETFILYKELASIMQKAGSGVEDVLFKHLENIGDVQYACVSGYFTGALAPTDLFVIGAIDDHKLENFVHHIERQVNREISYTPMSINEYQYRLNFNDIFLRQLFSVSYKELVNKLARDLQPSEVVDKKTPNIIRNTMSAG
ncbi:MAG: winged helix-turn-helix domain-containing protein [Acidobacteriota bacterium]